MQNSVRLLACSVVLALGSDVATAADWTEVERIAGRVDELMEAEWKSNEITPAEASGDAEFHRRMWLDLAGKIPRVADSRAFLASESPHPRRELIERLLSGPTYVTSQADLWSKALIPEAASDQQLRFLQPSFEAWLRDQLRDDVPYDVLVRDLLTAPITNIQGNPRGNQEPAPDVFFRGKQLKAEELAAATSRAFLGVRLECAQCHDHPFDVWKQEQFWSFAAFFSGVRGENAFAMVMEDRDSRELKIPDTEDVAEAAFLNEDKPDWSLESSRETLADWITASENPWFSRMAVNRMWGHFFGRGFVDPIDDFGVSNPPSHPETLDLLAEEFAAHDFDLKFLIRVIVSTRAYQLSSEQSDESQAAPELFARMNVKGLTPRQIFSSLAVALGTFDPFTVPGQFQDLPAETEFFNTFSNESDSVLERPTTILQALVMMNGDLITAGTSVENSRTLRSVIEYPFFSAEERVEALFLAALSRKPNAKERERLVKYVTEANPHDDASKALTDVYWALLNSSEFLFNH